MSVCVQRSCSCCMCRFQSPHAGLHATLIPRAAIGAFDWLGLHHLPSASSAQCTVCSSFSIRDQLVIPTASPPGTPPPPPPPPRHAAIGIKPAVTYTRFPHFRRGISRNRAPAFPNFRLTHRPTVARSVATTIATVPCSESSTLLSFLRSHCTTTGQLQTARTELEDHTFCSYPSTVTCIDLDPKSCLVLLSASLAQSLKQDTQRDQQDSATAYANALRT